MASFIGYMRKHGNLAKAWQTIKSNGRRSSSPYVTDEIEKFSSLEQTHIRSIAAKIQHGTFKFSPARAVALEKPNKPGSIRPIVIPRAVDRVVQRCILNALLDSPEIRKQAFQPMSFGGVPRDSTAETAGVPAAIRALLDRIGAGDTHVMIADISAFFTCIKKSDASASLKKLIDDERFLNLFKKAVEVDIENCEQIWRHKDAFPYGDIGVGQGVCLSPFLGNLVLSEFDEEMNKGDCTCIRYVDDILIIGPSGKAVSARFRKAKRLLAQKGMIFAEGKSDTVPRPVDQPFTYLGIELNKGKIRPCEKSRKSIVRRANEVAAKSLQAIRSANDADTFNQEFSIPRTLNKISGMSKGWANHYYFCNDIETIRNVDRAISRSFVKYSQKALQIAESRIQSGKSDLGSALLGYSGSKSVKFRPFTLSKQETLQHITSPTTASDNAP